MINTLLRVRRAQMRHIVDRALAHARAAQNACATQSDNVPDIEWLRAQSRYAAAAEHAAHSLRDYVATHRPGSQVATFATTAADAWAEVARIKTALIEGYESARQGGAR